MTLSGEMVERPAGEFGETEATGVPIRPNSASLESVTPLTARRSLSGEVGTPRQAPKKAKRKKRPTVPFGFARALRDERKLPDAEL